MQRVRGVSDPSVGDPVLPPFVVLEWLPEMDVVRAFPSRDEGQAHDLATNLARGGARVWFVDLCGAARDEHAAPEPSISRYVTPAGALWLHRKGYDTSEAGAGDRTTAAGL